jgi:hypothetical protein
MNAAARVGAATSWRDAGISSAGDAGAAGGCGARRGAPFNAVARLGTHLWNVHDLSVNSRLVAPFPGPSPASGEGWRTPGGAMVHAKERREVRRETVCNPSVSRRLDHS